MTRSDEIKEFPELKDPPIVEVICGVLFAPIPELDPLVLGIYWNERKADFPTRSLLPALADNISFIGGALPMRACLMSADEQFVLQLQHDRFIMNWRKKASDYPRFSGEGGLHKRATEEYRKFCAFVSSQFNQEPISQRVELIKIDLLQRGTYWQDLKDLAKMLPVTNVFSDVQGLENPEVNLRFVEKADDEITLVHVATLMQGEMANGVRIETRRTAKPEPDIATAFRNANIVIDSIFYKLISDARDRFGLKEKA